MIITYKSVMCDICCDCDPAGVQEPTAKEAREKAKKIGFIRYRGKDFCSETCKEEYKQNKST